MVTSTITHPAVDWDALRLLTDRDIFFQAIEDDVQETMIVPEGEECGDITGDDYYLVLDLRNYTWEELAELSQTYRKKMDKLDRQEQETGDYLGGMEYMEEVTEGYWPEIPGVTVVVADGHNNYAWPTVSEYVAQVGEKFDDILIG